MDYMNEQLVKDAINARGSREYAAIADGAFLSDRKCILAKCYECCNGYADGRSDCEIRGCPLYSLMPYSSKKRPKKTLSDEQRERASKRFSDIRKKGRLLRQDVDDCHDAGQAEGGAGRVVAGQEEIPNSLGDQ